MPGCVGELEIKKSIRLPLGEGKTKTPAGCPAGVLAYFRGPVTDSAARIRAPEWIKSFRYWI